MNVSGLSPPEMVLDRLLRDQRAALRTGDLDRLSAMAGAFERALRRLPPDLKEAELVRLRTMARENARLLQAALAGIDRVKSLRHVARSVDLATYDAVGKRNGGPAPGRTIARS